MINYNEIRRKTKKIKVGDRYIGGDAPIAVQSMLNVDTLEREAVLAQTLALEKAGCDVVRMTVPTPEHAKTLYYLKNAGVSVPLVADIHFDYKAAIEAAAMGADKIRINPGNIGGEDRVCAVVKVCREHNIPIRIGVNSGSLEKHILAKYGSPTAQALAESAMYHVSLLEKYDFDNIIVAIKSSDVRTMISANRILSEKCDYPLHLGVTEAGGAHIGTLKSAVGIGALLSDGIGDTIRVSLSADPTLEVKEGIGILRSIGIAGGNYINLTSCPTCGRTRVDIISLVNEFERRSDAECRPSRPLHVAIMGCAVNGPGEAREADIGVAGGVGEALLFKRGESVGKIPEDKIIDVLITEINKY